MIKWEDVGRSRIGQVKDLCRYVIGGDGGKSLRACVRLGDVRSKNRANPCRNTGLEDYRTVAGL